MRSICRGEGESSLLSSRLASRRDSRNSRTHDVHIPMLTPEQAERLSEWLPFVQAWSRRQQKIKDKDAAESAAVGALQRAVATWPGAGPFKGYLVAAVKNAWKSLARREAPHNHKAYPESLSEDFVPSEYDPSRPQKRPRKRYFGGESVVLREVIEREVSEGFRQGFRQGLRAIGCTPDEIEEFEHREKRRRQQWERRHPREEFEALFV